MGLSGHTHIFTYNTTTFMTDLSGISPD